VFAADHASGDEPVRPAAIWSLHGVHAESLHEIAAFMSVEEWD